MDTYEKWTHTAKVLEVVAPFLGGGSDLLLKELRSLKFYALDVPAVEWTIEDLEAWATRGAYSVTAESLSALYEAVLCYRVEDARMKSLVTEAEEQFA